jgi:ribosome-associated protein
LQTRPLPLIPNSIRPEIRLAIEAAQSKKAAAVTVLDLEGLGAFTSAFVLCTGYSSPQVQAISDAVDERLKLFGHLLLHREGYNSAAWVLLDYGSFVVHVFSETARLFYDIERLWRAAKRTNIPDVDFHGAAKA